MPSGKSSGVKLKGQKVFSKEKGLLSGLTLSLDLKKQLVIQVKKGKKNSKDEELLYSFKLNPVVAVKTAEVAPLTDELAAVLTMPDKENKITLGNNFSLVIPTGAVSTPMVISAKETKYTVEVMNEETGEAVATPALSSKYELNPDGAEFAVPLKITIPYSPDALPSDVSEDNLAVYLNEEKISTELDTTSKLAVADVWHFTSASINYPASNFVFPVNGLPGDTNCPGTWYSVVWSGTYNDGCKGTGGHPGVDIRVPSGTSVKAIASGFVHKSYDSSTWGGGLVVIKHEIEGISEPVWSVYAHLKRRDVQAGDPITVAGQRIGLSGGANTDPNHGTSTGPHLHFQIDKGATFLYPYWPSRGTEVFDTSLSANTYDPLKFIKDHMSAQPSCPNGNGLYCGKSSLGQNENTLYDCQDGNYSVQEQCANGCETMPSDANDQCKDAPTTCPNGNGPYCASIDSSLNANTLYYCQDGHYQALEYCFYGCETMPSGTNDMCSYGADSSLRAVYRFWSDQNKSHFYTISERERNDVIKEYPDDQWRYEGVAYYTYNTQKGDLSQVYRFWSDNYKAHFYTISESEKDGLTNNDPNWRYEDIAWYAYKTKHSGTVPVYRFWSDSYHHHFYTISESERDNLINNDPNWRYEDIAWYVFPSP